MGGGVIKRSGQMRAAELTSMVLIKKIYIELRYKTGHYSWRHENKQSEYHRQGSYREHRLGAGMNKNTLTREV